MNREYIINWCDKQMFNNNYIINDDMTVDVHGHVIIYEFIKKLPIKFRYIEKNFFVDSNELTTLQNFPQIVGGYLDITNNKLRDIYYIPKVSEMIRLWDNPVDILVNNFIRRVDKNDWIEFFNDCDIIRDDHIIWDRLVFFYDYLDIQIDKLWEEEILEEYKIIK